MDAVGVVGGIAGDVGLDRFARKALRCVLHPATARKDEDGAEQHERRNDAHRMNLDPPRGGQGYDWRNSRTRDFLPTRPRR